MARFRKFRKGKKKMSFAKKVQRVIDKSTEMKYRDLVLANTAISSTANIQVLQIPQSTTAQTDLLRLGDEVNLRNLEFRYNVYAGSTQVLAAQFRIVVFQWYDAATPTAADIFQDTSNTLITVSAFTMDTIRRRKVLKVLYDSRHVVSDLDSGTIGFSHMKRLKGYKKQLIFSAGGTSPAYGAIYVCAVSDAAANSCTCSYYLRSEWTDS